MVISSLHCEPTATVLSAPPLWSLHVQNGYFVAAEPDRILEARIVGSPARPSSLVNHVLIAAYVPFRALVESTARDGTRYVQSVYDAGTGLRPPPVSGEAQQHRAPAPPAEEPSPPPWPLSAQAASRPRSKSQQARGRAMSGPRCSIRAAVCSLGLSAGTRLRGAERRDACGTTAGSLDPNSCGSPTPRGEAFRGDRRRTDAEGR